MAQTDDLELRNCLCILLTSIAVPIRRLRPLGKDFSITELEKRQARARRRYWQNRTLLVFEPLLPSVLVARFRQRMEKNKPFRSAYSPDVDVVARELNSVILTSHRKKQSALAEIRRALRRWRERLCAS